MILNIGDKVRFHDDPDEDDKFFTGYSCDGIVTNKERVPYGFVQLEMYTIKWDDDTFERKVAGMTLDKWANEGVFEVIK